MVSTWIYRKTVIRINKETKIAPDPDSDHSHTDSERSVDSEAPMPQSQSIFQTKATVQTTLAISRFKKMIKTTPAQVHPSNVIEGTMTPAAQVHPWKPNVIEGTTLTRNALKEQELRLQDPTRRLAFL